MGMIGSYVYACLPIASADQITCTGIETSGGQARSGVRVLKFSNLFVIPMPRCRTAYIHGLEFCTGDFVIIMDADFSHHVRVFSDAVFVTLRFSVGNQAQVHTSVRSVCLSHITTRRTFDPPQATTSTQP